ncbi:MAG: hypothetical protein IT385_16895 [Deltaproteobacteria bacterium]|nr:hypothetical protein [Deltaproteobacteria bacterium]
MSAGRVLLSLSFLVAAAPTGRAQSFNLDVGDAGGLPSAAYGGAAKSPGTWQALDLASTDPLALVTLGGEASTVTVTASTALTVTSATLEGPIDDDARLLEDWAPLGATPVTLTLAGLAPGRYQVWTYAWSPDEPAPITYVAVNDDTQAVSGAWPDEGFAVFVTHALHELDVGDGDDVVVSLVGVDQGALGGLQLVRLPDDPPPVGEPRGFNLDAGTMFGQPSRGWGGAAEQVGVWMPLSFHAENPVTLSGLDGEPTTVTLEANLPFGPASFAHDGPSGDEERLLEDYLDLHSTGGTFTFKGVPPGDYVVYTYAWGPDDDRYRTRVTLGEETQEIGGAWTGALAQGITHARHAVTVPSTGKLEIYTFGTKGTLNGIQLVPVVDTPVEPGPEVEPEPAPEVQPEPAPDAEPQPEPDPEPEPQPDPEPEPEPAPEPDPEPEAAPEPTPEPAAEAEVVSRGDDDGCRGAPSGALALSTLVALALLARRARRRFSQAA